MPAVHARPIGFEASSRDLESNPGSELPSLRVVFVLHSGTGMRLALLAPHLAARGHVLHFSFGREPEPRVKKFLDLLASRFPRVTWSVHPSRQSSDGWRYVSWLVRGLADLSLYSHPRYRAAPDLRDRAARRMRHLLRTKQFEPLSRRFAAKVATRLAAGIDPVFSKRVIRWMAKFEEATPTSRRIDRYVREHAPDILVAGSFEDVDFLKSARKLGVPTGIWISNWDKLTTKGLCKWIPERVFVWNEIQMQEATELHGIPVDRLVAAGAHLFDDWFEQRPTRTREEFASYIGLEAHRPYVLYLGSNPGTTGHTEVEFVTRWIEALRSSGDERVRGLGIAVRPHPKSVRDWEGVDLSRFENVVICASTHPYAEDARADFFDSIVHSAAVVGINTTAMIEAAIAGKSVLTVLNPDFGQESTLHFHYLLAENGGFLHVAESLEQHAGHLAGVIQEDAAAEERRLRFVEAFVRPQGLDRPVTPILAHAIEELAEVAIVGHRYPWTPLLRPLLSLEARITSLYVWSQQAKGRGRKTAGRQEKEPKPGRGHAQGSGPLDPSTRSAE